METNRICLICEKEFTARRSTQITCSAKCRKEAYKREKLEYDKEQALIKGQTSKNQSLTAKVGEAKKQGMTYGQLQAEKFKSKTFY